MRNFAAFQKFPRARSSLGKALLLAGLAGSLTLAGGALQAQTVANDGADATPDIGLRLPDGMTVFGSSDPNVRRATAIVNGDIITGTEIDQRLALILAANGGKVPDEERERLRMQILRNLIDETLQIQEAKANEIDIDEAEVEQTYARVAQQNFGQDPAALDKYLTGVGSSPDSLKRQIRGEIAWNRLLGRNIQPFINVAEEEVREAMERLKAAKGTDEFRVGEIFLSANSENSAAVFENGRKIMEQLRGGGSFVAYARQFSEASTAAVGGDLGWIRLAQLPPQLGNAAREMQPGQLVGPIELPGGFSILYLIDKRQVLVANPRDALLSLKQISMEFPAGTVGPAAEARAKEFAAKVSTIKGCGQANDAAAAIGATVVDNDQVAVRDLPAQLQDLLLALQLGETTPPFGSLEDGVRVLMLCGRDDPKVDSGPSFDQLMGTMEEERINKRAQLYLRDLRRDAVIDYN